MGKLPVTFLHGRNQHFVIKLVKGRLVPKYSKTVVEFAKNSQFVLNITVSQDLIQRHPETNHAVHIAGDDPPVSEGKKRRSDSVNRTDCNVVFQQLLGKQGGVSQDRMSVLADWRGLVEYSVLPVIV